MPATDSQDAYTKFFGGGSIYCITPITQSVAMRLRANIRTEPVPAWDLRTPPALATPITLGLGGGDVDEEDDGDDGDDFVENDDD